MNRASPTLLEFMQYYMDHCPEERGETYRLAKELGGMLIENCREVLDAAPVYKDVQYPHAPQTTIDEKGNIKYEEVPRPAVRKLESYVKEMAAGSKITEFGSKRQVQGDLQRIYRIIKAGPVFDVRATWDEKLQDLAHPTGCDEEHAAVRRAGEYLRDDHARG